MIILFHLEDQRATVGDVVVAYGRALYALAVQLYAIHQVPVFRIVFRLYGERVAVLKVQCGGLEERRANSYSQLTGLSG